jgi:hypothetical protein
VILGVLVKFLSRDLEGSGFWVSLTNPQLALFSIGVAGI